MSAGETSWTIVGQGLAGTCLAWALWERGEEFRIIDRGEGGSSRVAAGMVNPVTGKNFEPSWRISEFLPDALAFYAAVEGRIGRRVWNPFPVLRLAGNDKEWRKIVSKLDAPEVAPWVAGQVAPPDGWAGAVELRGGGRLDTRAFMDGSRDFFEKLGCCRTGDFKDAPSPRTIRCEGAAGLLGGGYGPQRCAKGEILTVRAEDWDETRIRIGAGGWLVPLGGGLFKAGSTYEWNELDELPTAKGRARVEEIAGRLGGGAFEVIGHEAGVRPILRRSQPLIGPMADGGWMFNALGSKGSLYAPGMAARLAAWLVDGTEPEPEVDFRKFSSQSDGHE
ncbi:FAD-binding oxidoreductase [Luteolibacter yonseiensis]|uniref:FAD-binding oxidoreductase n=1 Tax=Luteolibacter yonseiensis TaxID=1144680 RepID=A0A934R1Y7_9BACT|nr:FAD-dependent oxidoreductase [Luteolibacter yonseiensis]MBK1816903.1 FAD-binding oxidoreductase [Luteolibacter yonseiensis]